MKAAIPDYMKFGAVREMHQPIAAGVALRCEVNSRGQTAIEAKIVDPVTIKKVEEGVLQGFSIGGRITGRDKLDKSIITGIRLTEVSLVDRPCNPEALVSLCKADDDEDDYDNGTEGEQAAREDDSEDEKSEQEPEKGDESGEEGGAERDGSESEEEEGDDEDDDAEKLAKLSLEHGRALSKILTLECQLKKIKAELDSHKKRPAPPKGVLRAVSKGEDATGPDAEGSLHRQAEAFANLGPLEQAQTLVKLIHGLEIRA
jgi:hypothetical protein